MYNVKKLFSCKFIMTVEQFDVIFHALLCMLSGLAIRVSLSLTHQKWVSTYHHTLSYILLPLITFIVTKVISGNIALSLGMIGALSIVRFRNPVKNPFELVIFFALITIGISMSVSFAKYGLLLTGGIVFSIFAAFFLEKIFSKFNLHIFSLSFDEGNNSNFLEITSSAEIKELHSNPYLLQMAFDKSSNEYHYKFSSRNKSQIDNIIPSINNSTIKYFEYRYA